MNRLFNVMLIMLAVIGMTLGVRSGMAADPAKLQDVNAILDRVEARYMAAGFSARFSQISTIKAMEITDTASGKLFVKRPGKMRWEYETPEPQIIVTDSRMLWVYRPQDHQVMIGDAPVFFGDGRGAGFLADMNQIREGFEIIHLTDAAARDYILRLIPKKPIAEVADILLAVDRDTFELKQIITTNAYGDETRIELNDLDLNRTPDDSLFTFEVPEGAEVLQLDQ